ncbi:sugar porter family MFS transporter [Quadrisphaera setariae]|uniref:Sugar porter family MFS transporter n=1 Tax=Quadrisphaera setariae TaxID=2593304 RepID=A0A5C8Z3V9_9ACTN|nr:sugar porter family MFS transporter [Quadrisphaera setariae]
MTTTSARGASKGPTTSHGAFLVRLTVIATLGGLLFGYDTGVIAGALLTMPDDLGLTTVQTATVVTVLLLPGAALGALFAGRIADRIGRRTTLLICGVVFLVGALGCALAPGFGVLVASRFVLGLGVGAAAVICPVYLAEMAPAEKRARIVTINELMIVSGQLLAFAINAVIGALVDHPGNWRVMLGVAAVPAVGLLLGMVVLPESPRWLALRGRTEEARAVLLRSRSAAEADRELGEISHLATEDRAAARTSIRSVLRQNPWMRRLVWIGVGLAAVQQATGINTVNYYGTQILADTGLGDQVALVSTIAIGVTSVTMTLLGIWLLGFVSRRRMLLTGFAGVVGSQVVLALVFLLPQSTGRSFTILAAMLVFVAFVQCFIGTGIWLMLSEIFPLAIRGFAMGLSVFVLWVVNGAISFAFEPTTEALGTTTTFLLFAAVNVASLFFVLRCAPETKGHTLESLEEHLRTPAGGVPAVGR